MRFSANFLSTQMSAECSFAEELYDILPLQIIQWVYILTSITSIILVFYTACNYLHRTIFENVTKELIIALYIFIIIYSICLIFAQGSQLVYRYIASEKCDAQVPKILCIFRYIITMITWSFVLVHIGITIQHLLSSFNFGIRYQKIAARLSIVFSFVYPLIIGILAYYKDSIEGRSAYCSGFTPNSEGYLMFNLYLILVLDILNTLVSFILWKYNKRRLITDRQSYDLSLSFHRKQNLYAMQQFLPVATLHAVFYIVFFCKYNKNNSKTKILIPVTVYFSQALRSNMSPGWYLFTSVVANVIPHYCFLCPLIFLFLIRRGRFKRVSHVHSMVNPQKNPNDMYFSALNDQWQ
ncbi:sra-2 [Pristionchus pacificus]|uniref:G protein-coupled receptor n=1 Tax=Pristionchus pacificus TaxID=54126 RepID=A0A2A6CS71_PRIPA|nr:sra-2 [Pristionchus pacificus]|eukprot:PDM80917.1 G protein-coupled receptor [Pristionchus pacificus]